MTTSAPPAFERFHAEAVREADNYKRSAKRNEYFAYGISASLIATGAAVTFSGIMDELSGIFNASLGFLIVLTEGLSRTFKPVRQAAHAGRAAEDLQAELWRFDVKAKPYDNHGHKAQSEFVERVNRIRHSGVYEDHVPADPVNDTASSSPQYTEGRTG